MSCIWCGCLHIEEKKEKKEMTNHEAIEILLKYAETDTADSALQTAIQVLKGEKSSQDFENVIQIGKNDDKKEFEVAVSQRQIITYKVLHDSADAAVADVQKKVKDRNWIDILQFPPGSPYYKPIPFLDYPIEKVSVKEDILRSNPFGVESVGFTAEGNQKSDT
jgi:predicted O-linked N-acetylglucosamine transferase (SPINDLY family)